MQECTQTVAGVGMRVTVGETAVSDGTDGARVNTPGSPVAGTQTGSAPE